MKDDYEIHIDGQVFNLEEKTIYEARQLAKFIAGRLGVLSYILVRS